MFYVSKCLWKGYKNSEDGKLITLGLYTLKDFTTKETQNRVSTNEIIDRVKAGEEIIRVVEDATTGNGYKITEKERKITLEDYVTLTGKQYLLDEWDYEKNELKPDEVTYGMQKKVFWLCTDRQHSYCMLISDRTREKGCNCPYCSNQTSFPEQVIFYYLSSCDLSVGNRFKYNNKYEIDIYLPDYNIGIEYDGRNWHTSDRKVEIDEEKDVYLESNGVSLIRLREEGCPDLETNCEYTITSNPDNCESAIKELFSVLRDKYSIPIDCDVNIERDKAEIKASYLALKKEKSIKRTHPEIVREWCYERNNGLRPEMFTFGSEEKVWWRCNVCSSEYQASIVSRCRYKSDCLTCARQNLRRGIKFLDKFPDIAPFWADERDMSDVTVSQRGSVKIRCPECGFEEDVFRLDKRIQCQEGLICKRCGYSVKVKKFEQKREEARRMNSYSHS